MRKVIVIAMLFSWLLAFNVYGKSISETAKEFAEFKQTIDIDTADVDGYMVKLFEYDPRLQLYYSGYTGSKYSNHATINVKYMNTSIPLKDIHVAENLNQFRNFLLRGLLYCDKKVYIVLKNSDIDSVKIDALLTEIQNECPLAEMFRDECNISSSSMETTNDSSYVLTISYDSTADDVMRCRKETEKLAASALFNIVAKDMPDYAKVMAIHDYIINNCRYKTNDEENTASVYHSAYGMFKYGEAVCQGYAEAAAILFNMCGIDNFRITGTAKGESHMWNAVKLDDSFYQIDMTWDDPVMSDGSDKLQYNYFNLNDRQMAEDHVWNRNEYTPCTGTYYNYENTKRLVSQGEVYEEPYDMFVSVFNTYEPLSQDIYVRPGMDSDIEEETRDEKRITTEIEEETERETVPDEGRDRDGRHRRTETGNGGIGAIVILSGLAGIIIAIMILVKRR